jgi:glycosyltransferase involved in cell wall biosynthesis
MTWPALAIVIVTFNRRDILLETIRRIGEHLDYTGPRHLIVADDGSNDGTIDALRAITPSATIPNITIAISQRVGMGANTNAGLRAGFALSEYVLQLQDDMHLLHHFDLHPHVARLRDDPTSGFVRLWGVGGHKYTATLDQSHWRIDWASDELYIPSDRPQLKHWRFHQWFGFYPESLRTDQTEDAFCHQCKDRAIPGAPAVLIPHGVDVERNFDHVGWHDRARDKGL